MSVICGIYKITSPTNKVYIGKSKDIGSRWASYKRLACKNQTYIYNSLKKYGHEKHTFEVIHVCEEHELSDLEIYYIKMFDCLNTGLNLCYNMIGGENLKLKKKKEQQRKLNKIAIQKRYLAKKRKEHDEYLQSDEYLAVLRTIKSPLSFIKMPSFSNTTPMTEEERKLIPF